LKKFFTAYKNKKLLTIGFIVGIFLLISLTIFSPFADAQDITLPVVLDSELNNTTDTYKENISLVGIDESRIQEGLQRREREAKINNLHTFLSSKNSIFSNKNISEIIITESEKYGADYRIITAMMGKESGYCNAPYKKYNCFGYLNKVQYSSYEEAFKVLVPKIAKTAAIHGWNTKSLAKAYGAVNWEHWGDWVYSVAVSI
jgi:hypothetical protein